MSQSELVKCNLSKHNYEVSVLMGLKIWAFSAWD